MARASELAALPLLDFLQIVDRSFPTGGFVHSYGLEWLLREGLIDLESVLRMRLREQLAHFELVFVLGAYSEDSAALDRRFHALILSREARAASLQTGRQFLQNCQALFPPMGRWSALPHGHYAIAFGVVGRALGIQPRVVAAAYAFQTVRGQISAAQRLSRLGQTEAQRLLHALKPEIKASVETAAHRTIDDAVPFAPLLEIAEMAHERSAVRLFVS